MGFKSNDRCLAKVDDDEPIFVLRAQDITALDTIRAWLTHNDSTLPDERKTEVRELMGQIRDWQDEHPDRVKRPD